jgi:hypothetical protein
LIYQLSNLFLLIFWILNFFLFMYQIFWSLHHSLKIHVLMQEISYSYLVKLGRWNIKLRIHIMILDKLLYLFFGVNIFFILRLTIYKYPCMFESLLLQFWLGLVFQLKIFHPPTFLLIWLKFLEYFYHHQNLKLLACQHHRIPCFLF